VINRWTKVRIGLCGVVLALLGMRVVKQAVQLQVREGPQLREMAEKNYLREMELAPRRGRILDRKGNELATTVDFDSVFCNPRQLAALPEDLDQVARKLASALGMDRREVERIIGQSRYFAWLKRRATPEESAAAMALGLPGVAISKEPGRVYPTQALASTVLGHTSIDGRGVEGVEIAFDKLLQGSGVRVAGIRDSYGRQLLVEGTMDAQAAAGHDLVLSLDKYLTFVTERALASAVEKHNALSGVAVMMDARNGQVLAMATHDAVKPGEAARPARNRAITDVFEPGSTMKTFTFVAAIDAGKLRMEDTFDCQNGRITIGKHTIRDDHPMGIGNTVDVFKHSSNIASIKIARRIRKEGLYDALVRYGFGRPTGIGLPGERRGTLHDVSRWGEIEFATHAYGHGIAATPLQLVAAFAAVASGGVYHPPRVVLHAIAPDGHQEPVAPPPGSRGAERVMSEKTARTMLKLMQSVTDKDATGYLASIDGYPVAGKTGTAIKVINGRYDHNRVVANFVGIVPVDDPRLVIGVMVDEPQPIHYGGKVAAPAFREIAEEALRYLGIPPSIPMVGKDKGKEKGKDTAKDHPAEPAALAESAGAEDLSEGSGFDLPLVEEESGERAEGAADEDGEERPELVTLPSFAGMSIGEAIRAARRAGVELAVEGSGVAVSQSPPAGPRRRGSVCRVSFRPGG
jgi:cell division protein FtsI (penicillin-binding protein 3)